MSQILNDFSTPHLVYAIKQNLYDFFGYIRQWNRADFYADSRLQRWQTPIPHPWFNGILSIAPPANDEAQTIRACIDYFKSKERDVFTWWLTPEMESSPWGGQLAANGFKPDNDTPGMAVALAALKEGLPKTEGLKIIRVEDAETMKQWANVFARGYGLPPNWEAPLLDMSLALGLDFPQTSYLAYVHDEPVAASLVFYSAGVAGIYNVATLAEWRGKGLGAAVTLQPLLDARQMGYRVGILQSSEMGFKVYQRLGFQELCHMSHYYWQAG